MHVQQRTVDDYLEAIITEAVDAGPHPSSSFPLPSPFSPFMGPIRVTVFVCPYITPARYPAAAKKQAVVEARVRAGRLGDILDAIEQVRASVRCMCACGWAALLF